MDADKAAALRAPIPPEQIGKLPRVTCKDCRDNRSKVCDKHSKSKCGECGNYITSAHMHLDYFGHAETTARLLDVDPGWTWEPVAFSPDGLPLLDHLGGLWIRLTVCGVSRLGYGHADGKTGPDAVKEAIGDALRNAAMRYGVALTLWAKSDLHADRSDHDTPAPPAKKAAAKKAAQPPVRDMGTNTQSGDPIGGVIPSAQAKQSLIATYGGDEAKAAAAWGDRGKSPISADDLNALLDAAEAEMGAPFGEAS